MLVPHHSAPIAAALATFPPSVAAWTLADDRCCCGGGWACCSSAASCHQLVARNRMFYPSLHMDARHCRAACRMRRLRAVAVPATLIVGCLFVVVGDEFVTDLALRRLLQSVMMSLGAGAAKERCSSSRPACRRRPLHHRGASFCGSRRHRRRAAPRSFAR